MIHRGGGVCTPDSIRVCALLLAWQTLCSCLNTLVLLLSAQGWVVVP